MHVEDPQGRPPLPGVHRPARAAVSRSGRGYASSCRAQRRPARRRSRQSPRRTPPTDDASASAETGEPIGARARRVHRDPRRAREQPQGRLAAHPQAQDHDLHRRVGSGQVVDRVRHHRHRSAAPAERELQHVHPQLPAALPAAGGRRHREPEHGRHRRPEAAGRRLALDGGHHHRHLHRCCACCSRASASRTSGYSNAFSFNDPQGMCPECNGLGQQARRRSRTTSSTCRKSLNEGAVQVPGSSPAGSWTAYAASGFFDNDKKLSRLHRGGDGPAAVRQADEVQDCSIGDGTMNATYEGIIEKFERARTSGATSRRCSERTQKAVAPYITPRPVPAVPRRAAEPGRARAAGSTAATSPSCRRWRSAS